MADQPKKPDQKASVGHSELFAGRGPERVQAEDLFAGRVCMAPSDGRSERSHSDSFAPISRGTIGGAGNISPYWIYLLLSLNMLLMGGVICFLVLRETPQAALATQLPSEHPETVQAPPATTPQQPVETPEPDQEGTDPSVLLGQIAFSRPTSEALKEAASLSAAEKLYESGEYYNACFMYDQLRRGLFGHSPQQQSLRDYLHLKMALCLQKTQDQELMSDLFTRALQSLFPVVRALAGYNLSFLELHNQQFISARAHAYQTLAALELFKSKVPATVEADCYFLAAECLTSYILKLADETDGLPGQGWSASTQIWGVSEAEQGRLQEFLTMGMDEIADASVVPVMSRDPQRSSGSQWDAICRDAPLEELLWKYSAAGETNVEWADVSQAARRRPVSLYLPNSTGAWVAEAAAGSAGLLWRYDGEKAMLYDPEQYTDFDAHKTALIREAIATWQRFLLKYRGDERAPNAHYMLGMLYAMEKESATALGEYKLLASQYASHSLAPFALLNSSKIKTNLMDFDGARSDLQELLIQYPECKVVDEASLYLAEAAAGSGDFAQAEKMFRKVFQINLTESIRSRAAYGLGRCAFDQKDYAAAAEWLSQAVQLIRDRRDSRLTPACFMLGQAFVEVGEYSKASVALRMALEGDLAAEDYVNVVLELVRAEEKQENYVQALKLIESIPEPSLNQEQACEVLLARARVLQAIDLTESAISLLRRRIEYIAEASIRARLVLELANCYATVGDWRIAEKELRESVYDLEDPQDMQRAFCLLAEVSYKQGKVESARELCEATLKEYPQDSPYRPRLLELLGTIYTQRKDYEAAALAYAGLLPASGAETP